MWGRQRMSLIQPTVASSTTRRLLNQFRTINVHQYLSYLVSSGLLTVKFFHMEMVGYPSHASLTYKGSNQLACHPDGLMMRSGLPRQPLNLSGHPGPISSEDHLKKKRIIISGMGA